MDMDEPQHMPQKKFRRLPKPKYAEEYSLKECAMFQPWRVVLKVEPDANEEEPLDYEIFLRAQDPNDAQWTAYHAFMVWEHLRPGIPDDDYPRVSTSVQSEAFKLDEDTWNEFWKEAQSYPHTSVGDKRNPSIFRFAKPGWDRKSSIITSTDGLTIRHDKAAVDAFLRTLPRR